MASSISDQDKYDYEYDLKYNGPSASHGHIANRVETVTHAAAVETLTAMMVEAPLAEYPAHPVLSLFKENRLLARATETEVLSDVDEDHPRLKFECHQREIDAMAEGRFKNVSSTLLIPGSAVNTYKPYGFLMNAKTATILHAATHDIGSFTNGDGSLNASAEENMSLDELTAYVKKFPGNFGMNEVNANFNLKDLEGLFVCRSDSSYGKVDVLVLQKMIQAKYGIALPIFQYDPDLGKLAPYEPTDGDKLRLLLSLREPNYGKRTIGVIKAQLVAPYLGYSVSDAGRIQKV